MKKVLDVILGFIEGAFFTAVIIFAVFFIYSLAHKDNKQEQFDSIISGEMDDGSFRIVTDSRSPGETAACWASQNGVLSCKNGYVSQYSGKQKFVWEFDAHSLGEEIVCIEVYDSAGNFNRVDIFQITNDPQKGLSYALFQEKSPALLEQIHSTMVQIS
ncbi:MAG: hypothetical protein IJ071_09300 [Ruminococcus sp.]|nr:hypothetical protein [Ruminococcus sp.]